VTKGEEQLGRTRRWLHRLQHINDGFVMDLKSFESSQGAFIEEKRDDFLAFFLNCYHVKDWIRNDTNGHKALKDAVEEYLKQTVALQITRELCHGAKHLRHDQHGSRESLGTHWRGRSVISHSPHNSDIVTITLKFHLDAQGGFRDAFEVAEASVTAWERFFELTEKELALFTPKPGRKRGK
jgi:hypothetical protein